MFVIVLERVHLMLFTWICCVSVTVEKTYRETEDFAYSVDPRCCFEDFASRGVTGSHIPFLEDIVIGSVLLFEWMPI